MTDKTPSRIAFEAWAKDGLPIADMSQTHAWLAQSCAWLAWQAATEREPKLDAPFLPVWANYRQGVADGRDEEARRVGCLMLTALFDIAQRPGVALDTHECAAIDRLRNQWDAAIAKEEAS